MDQDNYAYAARLTDSRQLDNARVTIPARGLAGKVSEADFRTPAASRGNLLRERRRLLQIVFCAGRDVTEHNFSGHTTARISVEPDIRFHVPLFKDTFGMPPAIDLGQGCLHRKRAKWCYRVV